VGIHHLDLVVSSLERSLLFYRELLAPLGYTRVGDIVGERGETVYYIGGGDAAIGVREARVTGAYDRYRVGMHHVAFEASSRDVVDERYAWARENGVESNRRRRTTTTGRATTHSSSTTRTASSSRSCMRHGRD